MDTFLSTAKVKWHHVHLLVWSHSYRHSGATNESLLSCPTITLIYRDSNTMSVIQVDGKHNHFRSWKLTFWWPVLFALIKTKQTTFIMDEIKHWRSRSVSTLWGRPVCHDVWVISMSSMRRVSMEVECKKLATYTRANAGSLFRPFRQQIWNFAHDFDFTDGIIV